MADRDPTHLTRDTQRAMESLARFAAARGVPFTLVETYRPCERQMSLYAQGRSTPGDKVTWVNGCHSWHAWARAFDIDWNTPKEALEALGAEWERMGGVWGGHFGDFVHFEWHPGMKLSEWCPGAPETAPLCPTFPQALQAGASGAADQMLLGAIVVGLGYTGYLVWQRSARA